MRRRLPVALLFFLGAVIAAIAAVPVGRAESESSPSEREATPITLVAAPDPTTSSTRTSFPDLGLPPLPPTPTFVPDGALDVASSSGGSVAVFGDSLTLQAWAYVDAIASAEGRPLSGGAYGGLALCDWLPVISDALNSSEPPRDIVLAFAGNNITPCLAAHDGGRLWGDELVTAYVRDARAVIEAARGAGTRVTIVGPPAMGVEPQATHAHLLRIAFERLAGESGARFVDAGAALSPAGYTTTLPCLPFETEALGCTGGRIRVREADDVHLAAPDAAGYSSGAWRWATLLLAA